MTDGIRVTTNNFHYASWYKRLFATLIDITIIWLVVLLLIPGSFKISNLIVGGNYSDILSFLLSFDGVWFWLLPSFYMIVCSSLMSRTFGMMIMKIRIADYNGGNISVIQALLRFLALLLAVIPLFVGLIPILFNKKKQGVHDMLVKTIVVHKR